MAIANITGNILTDTGVATSSLLPLTGGTLTGALNGTSAVFSSTIDGTIINSTSNAFRLNGNNALSLVTLNSQSVVKINAAGFWGVQLVGANDQGIVINNTGNVGIGTSSPNAKLSLGTGGGTKFLIYDGGFTGSGGNGYFAGFAVDSPNANDTTLLAHHQGALVFGRYTNANDTSAITERMRITSGGDVGIGDAGSSATRLTVKGSGATSSTNAIALYNSSATTLFYVRNDGLVHMPVVYNNTGGGSGTVAISASGELYRATSSIKYKENVIDYNKGLNEVLQLRPVYYNVKREDDNNLYAGFIAEEIDELGLTEFVQYAEDGTPDALHYPNMIALLTKAIQELNAKVSALENK